MRSLPASIREKQAVLSLHQRLGFGHAEPSVVHDDGLTRVYEVGTAYYVAGRLTEPSLAVVRLEKGWQESHPRLADLVDYLNRAYPVGLPGKSSSLRGKVMREIASLTPKGLGLGDRMLWFGKTKITFEQESEIIRENAKKPEAQKPHKFKSAEWTHKNGHPRCLVCGDEETISGVCDGLMEKSYPAPHVGAPGGRGSRPRSAVTSQSPKAPRSAEPAAVEFDGKSPVLSKQAVLDALSKLPRHLTSGASIKLTVDSLRGGGYAGAHYGGGKIAVMLRPPFLMGWRTKDSVLQTIRHELGHYAQERFQNPTWNNIADQMAKVPEEGLPFHFRYALESYLEDGVDTGRGEFFAVAFSYFVGDPAFLARIYPEAHKFMREVVFAEPR